MEPRTTGSHDSSHDEAKRFLRELRQLRADAGLATAELAARAHYPHHVIVAAEAGPALPDLPVLSAYLRGCGAGLADWEERWRTLTGSPAAAHCLPSRQAGCSDLATAGARVGAVSPEVDANDQRRIMAAISRAEAAIAATAIPAQPQHGASNGRIGAADATAGTSTTDMTSATDAADATAGTSTTDMTSATDAASATGTTEVTHADSSTGTTEVTHADSSTDAVATSADASADASAAVATMATDGPAAVSAQATPAQNSSPATPAPNPSAATPAPRPAAQFPRFASSRRAAFSQRAALAAILAAVMCAIGAILLLLR